VEQFIKCFRIVSFGAIVATSSHCGGSVEPAPCASAEAGDDAPAIVEAGALDAPEGGPISCWRCEMPAAPGAYNACTHLLLEVCESCEVFGPECTPLACEVCAAKDAAAE